MEYSFYHRTSLAASQVLPPFAIGGTAAMAVGDREEELRFEELWQVGFTRVEQWDKGTFNAAKQKALLAAVADDTQQTVLK